MAMLKCGYCKGKGVDPHFGTSQKPSSCAVCKGRKENFVPDPSTVCPVCQGNGNDPRYRTLPDSFCQGKGLVPQYKADEYAKSH